MWSIKRAMLVAVTLVRTISLGRIYPFASVVAVGCAVCSPVVADSPSHVNYARILDGPDGPETLRADFVDCVIGCVPPGIFKINNVRRRNTDRVQRYVIVDELPAQVGKIVSQLKRFCRGKNTSRNLGRGICGKRYAERPVANHVEQQPAAKLFRAAALKSPGKIAASVQTIRLRKLFKSFFAIKKHQFDFLSQTWLLPDYPG